MSTMSELLFKLAPCVLSYRISMSRTETEW